MCSCIYRRNWHRKYSRHIYISWFWYAEKRNSMNIIILYHSEEYIFI